MKVSACELRNVITIEEYAETQDTTGQPVKAWTLFATVRAKIDTTSELVRSNEVFAGSSLVPKSLVIFTIRYLSGLTEKMRIVYGGRNYDILAVADVDARHAYHEIRAVYGLNDG